MKTFKELGITAEVKGFAGEKIKADKILNREVEVHGYMIKPSRWYSGQTCIWLHVKHNNDMRVVFLQGKKLEEVLAQIEPDGFPFKTTIVKENDWYDFT